MYSMVTMVNNSTFHIWKMLGEEIFNTLIKRKKLWLSIETKNFPRGSVVENLPANAGDASLIPGLGKFPGEGNGKPP